MKRTVLNPVQAAWLAQTIDQNRRTFGGVRMMADDTGTEGDKGGGTRGDKTAEKPDQARDEKSEKGSQELGEGGKKAIEAEREARKNAEDQMKTLKGEFDGFKSALVEALGIKPKDGDKGGTDALTAVQEQLVAMQHESAMLKLANTHKITDKDDLELLGTAKDADAMRKLAERLAPTQEEGDAKSRKPKPDNSQGNGRKDDKAGGGSVAQVMADRAAARAARNQS